VDGEPSDSLLHREVVAFDRPDAMELGARLETDRNGDTVVEYGYTGRLARLRVWSRARSDRDIRRTSNEKLAAGDDRVAVISFDDDDDRMRRAGITLVDDSPFGSHGIREFAVRPGREGVRISWYGSDGDVRAFQVERSQDGIRYVDAGRVEAGMTAETPYSFVDSTPGEGVRYYRIRELLNDGTYRVSDPVKVGMGERGDDRPVVLTGNFPNPFNPATRIAYTVREPVHVRLSVWDLSGQLITTLVDEIPGPGYHEVPFDAEGLPSGTYFVRLQTPQGTQSHQMVLMK
jgi:hypothetical protein